MTGHLPEMGGHAGLKYAIEEGGKYYYWAKGISLEITDWEYAKIKLNPKLYYFSTTLKLHHRIDRSLKAGISKNE